MKRIAPTFILFLALITSSQLMITSGLLSAQEISKEEEAFYVAQKAQEDGFYEVALGLYQGFLKNYPHSKFVPEVKLNIGQCYFFQNKFLDALKKFNALLRDSKAESIKDASLYWAAEVHFRGNNFKQAASFYQKVITLFPDSRYVISSYYSLGWCLYQLAEYSDALRYFAIVTDKASDKNLIRDAHFKVMDCYYYLKDYRELKNYIQKYSKSYPKDKANTAFILFYLSEADYYLGNYRQSADSYIKTIKNTKDQSVLNLSRLGLGWSCIKLEEYEKAEDIFNQVKAQTLEKNNLEVLLLGKAALFAQTKRFNESLKVNSEILDIATSDDSLMQAYLGKAEALYNLSKYQEAIGLYDELLDRIDFDKISDELVEKLHYNWAWAYLKAGEFKKAISEFQKAASNSNDRMVKIASLCLAADAYQDAGQYNQATQAYGDILKNYPDSFYSDYIYYQLGISLLRMSNYDAAVLNFKSLIVNYPKSNLNDKTAYALGLAFFQKEDYAKSIEALEVFLKEHKDSFLRAEALYLWASALYNMAEFAKAIDIFNQIIKLHSQDKGLVQKADYEIADCYYRMGQEEEAVKRFEHLRVKYPDSSLTVEALWWLGAYYYRLGELDSGRKYFETILNDFPNSNLVADASYALGSVYEEEKNYQQAIEQFEKVIKIGEPDLKGQARLAIADILVKRGQFELALKTYEQIGLTNPNLSVVSFPKIAGIFKSQGKYDQAIEFYHKALKTSPLKRMNTLQFELADCYQEQGRIDQAIEEYLKVTYLYPQDSSLVAKALIRVGQIYEGKEEFREASNIYRKILSIDAQEAKYAQERIEELERLVNN